MFSEGWRPGKPVNFTSNLHKLIEMLMFTFNTSVQHKKININSMSPLVDQRSSSREVIIKRRLPSFFILELNRSSCVSVEKSIGRRKL